MKEKKGFKVIFASADLNSFKKASEEEAQSVLENSKIKIKIKNNNNKDS